MPWSACPNSWKRVVHVRGGDERGLARGGLGEVGVVRDGRLPAEQPALVDEAVAPRAAALRRPQEEIAVVQGERAAVGVEDLPDADVRMVDGDVLALLEGDAVHLVGGEEDAVLENPLEIEVGPDLRLVEVVLRLAHLLRVEVPVRRGDLEAALRGVDLLLDRVRLSPRFRGRRRDEVGSTAAPRSPASSPSGRRARSPPTWRTRGASPFRPAEPPSSRRWPGCRSGPPWSPRAIEAARMRWRRARFSSEASGGCCVVFCMRRSHFPSSFFSFAASPRPRRGRRPRGRRGRPSGPRRRRRRSCRRGACRRTASTGRRAPR